MRSKELHEKAAAIALPLFEQARINALDTFTQLYHTDGSKASGDLKEIVPAAVFGRVDTLFLPKGKQVWGRYDAEQNTVILHDQHQSGDECLLDLAAVHTYLNGGTVYVLPPEEMPREEVVAATFRYPSNVLAQEAS